MSVIQQQKVGGGWAFIASGLPIAAASYGVLGGAATLAGWMLSSSRLTDWFGNGITMKANAAICAIAAGSGVLLAWFAPSRKTAIQLLGLLTALITAATLFEHFTGIDLRIDTLLFYEAPFSPATSAPGRMGMPAATSLLALGVALILSAGDRPARVWTSFLGLAAVGISALSLVGYLFGADQLFAVPKFTGIALQTATIIAALGAGIVALIPEQGMAAALSRPDAGGLVFRRLFFPVVAISLVMGWLRVTGEHVGLYDSEFGTAARTLLEVSILIGLLWWTANGISRADRRARDASRAVADRDERLGKILEALDDSFMSVDSSLRFTYANPAVKRIWAEYGVADMNVIGKYIFDVFPEAIGTELGRAFLRAAAEHLPIEIEEYYSPLDRWYSTRCFPTADGGLSMFAHDITGRKRAERAQAKRSDEIAALFDFTDRLQRARSMDDVYEAALDAVTVPLECDRASILLFDDAGVMRFVASRGLSDEYKAAVTGHSPWKLGENDARPIGIEDIETAELDDKLRSVIKGEGIGALGFIPLISNEILIGKFMVYYNEPRVLSDAEFEIAMTVGYQIASGVERKRTEDALRENEERLRLATQTGLVGVWDWDIKAKKVAWTESVYAMHGLEPGGFDGKVESFLQFVHPDDREFTSGRIEAALNDSEPYNVEFRVVRPDGKIGWLFTNALVLRDASGPYRMIGATTDVTDRKQAEAELGKLAAIVSSSYDAIISKDLNGVITSWNRGAEHLFGYTAAEAVGRPIMILIPDDHTGEEADILKRIRRGEVIDHYETVRQHKDRRLLDISLTISPIVNSHGKIIGASKIARDMTERKRAEAAMRESEIMHRLVEAQEGERQRIARDLHDHLGQQMTALRLQMESLLDKNSGDRALNEKIDKMRQFAARIDRDIGFLSWELRPTELDHLGLVDALGSFVREWSGNYGIAAEFHTDIAESGANNGRLSKNIETNLYRIVQEGLNNILKHAYASSVSILLHQREDDLVLIIEDNGKGFDPEFKSSNGGKGTGLGLVGMHERTALMKGVLEIESLPGEGTTVLARIPLN